MSGPHHRRKGDRIKRELVHLQTDLGVKAERYPLSGASLSQFAGLFRRICACVGETANRKPLKQR
jgi:Holliday junction resolvase